MSVKQFASGHCLCGNVSYKIFSEPVRMAQCHYNDCQKSTGTGHVSNAVFSIGAIMIDGDTNSYTAVADNGAEVTRHFCPECVQEFEEMPPLPK